MQDLGRRRASWGIATVAILAAAEMADRYGAVPTLSALRGATAMWSSYAPPLPARDERSPGVDELPPAAPPGTLRIRAVGDIQLDRGVERAWEENDLFSLFAGARHALRAADITFGNLESIPAHAGEYQGRPIAFHAHPNGMLPLVDAGFDVLSLANNHAYDYGRDALLEAAARLRAQGLVPLGVREGSEARPRHEVVTRNGIRVGFLAYAAFPFNDAPVLDAAELAAMRTEIAAARKAADVVVVSFHWGVEYEHYANKKQRDVGRLAIDAGADLVIGHHPHVSQGIELYEGRVIAYSLGNFLFDQQAAGTRDGLLLDWYLDEAKGQHASLYPVRIDSGPYRARILIGDEAREVLGGVADVSAALGTETRLEDGGLQISIPAPGDPTRPGQCLVDSSGLTGTSLSVGH